MSPDMSIGGTGVLVGVDGSVCSQHALAWAAADAWARRSSLTVAAVVDLSGRADVPLTSQQLGAAEWATRRRLAGAVARGRKLAAGMPVRGRLVSGDPGTELLRLAADADEVVVGSHGTSETGGLLLGSVGDRVAGQAACPAVVVRSRPVAGPVVVGIDNSPHSERALEYAFGYADRHGLPLVALHAYALAPVVYPVLAYPLPPYPVTDQVARIRAEATRIDQQGLEKWTEKYIEVQARVETIEGPAAQALVEASRTASLVVVGTGGRGGRTGIQLGPVSHAVLRHAHGPVAVAR